MSGKNFLEEQAWATQIVFSFLKNNIAFFQTVGGIIYFPPKSEWLPETTYLDHLQLHIHLTNMSNIRCLRYVISI